MKWINEFKIAVIEKDIEKADELLDKIPRFKEVEQMQTAYALIEEAKKIALKEQEKLRCDMQNLKKSKKFFEY
jgi:hypothetical protein